MREELAKVINPELISKKIQGRDGVTRTHYVRPANLWDPDELTLSMYRVPPAVELDANAQTLERVMFGRQLTPVEWGRLVGGIAGAEVAAHGSFGNPSSIYTVVGHPQFASLERSLYQFQGGLMTLENESIEKRVGASHRYFGVRVVATQLIEAQRLGFRQVECFAAGLAGSRTVGSYVWVALGFDADLYSDDVTPAIRARVLAYARSHGMSPPRTLWEMLSQGGPEALEWWKREGRDGVQVRFQLASRNPQWEIMIQYLKERGIWLPNMQTVYQP